MAEREIREPNSGTDSAMDVSCSPTKKMKMAAEPVPMRYYRRSHDAFFSAAPEKMSFCEIYSAEVVTIRPGKHIYHNTFTFLPLLIIHTFLLKTSETPLVDPQTPLAGPLADPSYHSRWPSNPSGWHSDPSGWPSNPSGWHSDPSGWPSDSSGWP